MTNIRGDVVMNRKLSEEERLEESRFKTIEEFKFAMECNSEVEFEWRDKLYYITHPDCIINIHEEGHHLEAKEYQTADEALEYIIDGQKLRDIITKVKVWDRTI